MLYLPLMIKRFRSSPAVLDIPHGCRLPRPVVYYRKIIFVIEFKRSRQRVFMEKTPSGATAGFTRSLAANEAASVVVAAARDGGWLDRPVAVAPELAAAEKKLIIRVLAALDDAKKTGRTGLDADTVGSMFTFVFARSAEAVSALFNHQEPEFSMAGLFDGRAPFYADERIAGFFKQCSFPTDCASRYWEWFHAHPEYAGAADLTLGEALKWCFRLGCHIAMLQLPEPE